MENNDHDISDFDYDDVEETQMDDSCQKCHREYDDADYDFQICHWCGYNNNQNKRV